MSIYRYTVTLDKDHVWHGREEVLLSLGEAQRLADECWLEGFYSDAAWYDRIARTGKPQWDTVSSWRSDVNSELPAKLKPRLSFDTRRPQTFYLIRY